MSPGLSIAILILVSYPSNNMSPECFGFGRRSKVKVGGGNAGSRWVLVVVHSSSSLRFRLREFVSKMDLATQKLIGSDEKVLCCLWEGQALLLAIELRSICEKVIQAE
jgi:hypothetical protein